MYYIRIKPDWNVKIYLQVDYLFCFQIRIKPDWNVKKFNNEGKMIFNWY